eukprot:jgi/Undpi1/11950/HiC_scaffold_4.g01649.m1
MAEQPISLDGADGVSPGAPNANAGGEDPVDDVMAITGQRTTLASARDPAKMLYRVKLEPRRSEPLRFNNPLCKIFMVYLKDSPPAVWKLYGASGDFADAEVRCAYHAWRFNSEGKCLNIPQSERGGKDELSPAACLEVYPTQVAQDIIWVWGDNGPDAGLESAVSPAALIPVLEDAEVVESGRVSTGSIYQRDVPYAWETFVENFLDPSHVTVAHHAFANSLFIGVSSSHLAPCVAIDAINKDGSVIKLISYSIPTRPGWCRMLFRQSGHNKKVEKRQKEKKKGKEKKRKGKRKIKEKKKKEEKKRKEKKNNRKRKKRKERQQGKTKLQVDLVFHPHKLPEWLQHLSTHLFVHQDLVFLHHQEKILASAGIDSSNYASGVFTPAASDKGVTILRKWIKQIASGGPPWSEGCDTALPSREHNRDVLFDVYRQHTQGCTICMGALTNANRCLSAAKASAVASLTWAILRGARALGNSASPSPSVMSLVAARAMLPALVTMSIALGAIKVLDIVIRSFKTGSFHHQDND